MHGCEEPKNTHEDPGHLEVLVTQLSWFDADHEKKSGASSVGFADGDTVPSLALRSV